MISPETQMIIDRLDLIIELLRLINKKSVESAGKNLLDKDAYSVLTSIPEVSSRYLYHKGWRDKRGVFQYQDVNKEFLSDITVRAFLSSSDSVLARRLVNVGKITIKKSKRVLKILADVSHESKNNRQR